MLYVFFYNVFSFFMAYNRLCNHKKEGQTGKKEHKREEQFAHNINIFERDLNSRQYINSLLFAEDKCIL